MKQTIGLSMLLLLGLGGMALAQEGEDTPERRDLLTFANGTVFVSQTGLATGSASGALLAVNGDPYRMALALDRNLPVEFIFKLPAVTTFDRFAIPGVQDYPGNTTFVKEVVVSGSSEGPDSGFQELAAFALEPHGPDQTVTERIPTTQVPVRWIKIRFDGGLHIGEGQEGRTAIRFSELIGNGVQEPQELSTAFDGIWDFRTAERLDREGIPLELHQHGATITGCLGRIELQGTVNGSIARATGFDTLDERPSAFIFVADEDGSIAGLWSRNKGRFSPRNAVEVPDLTSTPCSQEPPMPKACGASVYINFDVNSAVIRPESEQVLADLYAQLRAEGAEKVSIVGHTSTEGSKEHNLDLSERRAQSVVDDLIERGFDGASLTAVGEGESQPLISPDDNETARELNRRVEISCSGS